MAGDRRGATLVMVAISLVVIVGFAAVGLDFAKAYAARTRLKTVADAAAMAGAIQMLTTSGAARNTAVPASAATYKNSNPVEGSQLADSITVQPIIWNFAARMADSATTFADSRTNAVRVTAYYRMPTLFASVLDTAYRRLALRERTIAALGGVGSQSCQKPWAVPYSNVKVTLGYSAGDTTALTTADIASLVGNQTSIQFKTSANNGANAPPGQGTIGGSLIPGDYYAVDFPPVMDANNNSYQATYGSPNTGASVYADLIANACDDVAPVRIGDWLQTETGNMNGPTQQGVAKLCNIPKGSKGDPDACDPQQLITVPIYGQAAPKNGKTAVQVRYIGEFYVTQIYKDGTVVGYLTAMRAIAGSGSFSSGVGPTMRGALVQ